MIDNKNYSKDELVYLSKLYEKAEKYDEMIKCISKFVQIDGNLNSEEKKLFFSGFKNTMSSRRTSWRVIAFLEIKEEKKNRPKRLSYLKEVKQKVEEEMKSIIVNLHNLINNYLIPACKDIDGKIYYLKLKADYYRYKSEFIAVNDKENSIKSAAKCYQEAYELSKDLDITNVNRLSLSLNYSVFFYEILNDKEEAFNIVKDTLEEASKSIDTLKTDPKKKEGLLIIQLMQENLNTWINEEQEE